MITEEELRISNESYTNKDFISIYPELLNIIKKFSPKWDPSLSNESDPGNVILKAIAFLADKVNYNTDKAVLENYPTSVTQDTSARRVFEMNGYFPKYYQSATTNVKFRYNGSKLTDTNTLTFPAFDTVITDEDNTVSYSLLEPLTLDTPKVASDEKQIMQGTFKTLTIGNGDIVQLSDLDDNNRVYFPETMVAQNGVFVFSADNYVAGVTPAEDSWTRVDNLNLVEPNSPNPSFKFGFDSDRNLPYVEFTSNISELIGEGLIIKYAITMGNAGNISARFLTRLVSPLQIGDFNFELPEEGASGTDLDANNLVIYNTASTINGADAETINEAYNGFKKTVGTFDTLTTCKDYSNAIYNLVDSATNYPYVSNVQVTDRRSDINYGNTIVTYASLGKEVVIDTDDTKITPYTLCLYPLCPIYDSYDLDSYVKSFKPLAVTNSTNLKYIKAELEDLKNLSHTYQNLDSNDIYAIKNYYKLNIRITPTYKVNAAEQASIKENIRKALYKSFNARKVDYGYEIPEDLLRDSIQNADARIKYVDVDKAIDTRVLLANGEEVSLLRTTQVGGADVRDYYIRVLAKNILAGRLPLFEYDEAFDYVFGQAAPAGVPAKISKLKSVTTEVSISATDITASSGYELKEDEMIQCIAPNLATVMTYPAYINFHWDGDTVPANTEYKLTGTDALYINYTDSDSKQPVNIKYYAEGVVKNGRLERKDVYIKTNFDMEQTKDTYSEGHRSTDIRPNPWDPNMHFNSLATNEQIEYRDIVARVIADPELYCYWSTQRQNNKLFSMSDAVLDENDNIMYYETILGDNEYFAYCDAGLTDIVIRGSGTRLRWNYTGVIDADDWICEKQSVEELQDDGISAFSNFNWQLMSFKNNTLGVYEMQILTLGYKDIIWIDEDQDLASGEELEDLSNKWQPVYGDIRYQLDGDKTDTTLPRYSDSYLSWKIRSRLDLNCGPNLGQEVREGQKFTFTYDNNGTDAQQVVEYSAANDPMFIALSEYVSVAGGENIDLTVTELTIDGMVSKSSMSAYIYKYEVPTYPSAESSTGKQITKKNGYYYIPVSAMEFTDDTDATIELPLITDSSSQTLVMFYINKDKNSSYAIDITASGGNINVFNSGATPSSSIALCTASDDEKMIVVEVANGVTNLTIDITRTAGEKGVCNLYIGDITKNAIRTEGTETHTLNPKFELSQAEEAALLNAISDLDINNLFYYNCPIDLGSAIDIDDTAYPEFFWDRNNVYNKLTIGEIDFDKDTGSTISIEKAYQLK